MNLICIGPASTPTPIPTTDANPNSGAKVHLQQNGHLRRGKWGHSQIPLAIFLPGILPPPSFCSGVASRPWWVGVGGITERFGIELDSKAIPAVPVLLVVGELDADPAEVPIDRDESVWMEGINDSGRTRRERITTLQRSLEAIGASTRLVIVPNVAHAGLKVFAPVIEFFSWQIRG